MAHGRDAARRGRGRHDGLPQPRACSENEGAVPRLPAPVAAVRNGPVRGLCGHGGLHQVGLLRAPHWVVVQPRVLLHGDPAVGHHARGLLPRLPRRAGPRGGARGRGQHAPHRGRGHGPGPRAGHGRVRRGAPRGVHAVHRGAVHHAAGLLGVAAVAGRAAAVAPGAAPAVGAARAQAAAGHPRAHQRRPRHVRGVLRPPRHRPLPRALRDARGRRHARRREPLHVVRALDVGAHAAPGRPAHGHDARAPGPGRGRGGRLVGGRGEPRGAVRVAVGEHRAAHAAARPPRHRPGAAAERPGPAQLQHPPRRRQPRRRGGARGGGGGEQREQRRGLGGEAAHLRAAV
mmetsp:Transcript_10375/g.35289  ORF Transcript_10375/g.35289 Transcript_10375/m.35289 type:complete len:345 (-) Transcript_10375:370-1404(-)